MDMNDKGLYSFIVEYQKIREHLNTEYTKPVRDPLWKHIYLSEGLYDIISDPEFQKLTRIRQLGPIFHVYPGATHTRFNHSLGVFHLARKIINTVELKENSIKVSLEGVKAFLCACLLHDIGHFPYAHSLKELPLKSHEHLSGIIILGTSLKKIIKEKVGADPEMVASIVDTSLPDSGSSQITFFRNILSGVLDPDKLDYLNRDAFYCGVPYGMQDIDYIISKMVPHKNSGIAVSEQGLPGIENILFSKYLMYKTVYWHKTVRIATSMIKKAILLGLKNNVISGDNLYFIDDNQFSAMLKKESFKPFRLVESVNSRQLFKTVLETNFINTNKLHTDCLELEERLKIEKSIASDLGLEEDEVIIDIPEPISFEVQVPVIFNDVSVSFTDTETVFQPDVIRRFSSTLRKLRIFMPENKIRDGQQYFGTGKWTL